MTFELIVFLGILSGVLQIVGYTLYIKDEHIDPNPITWFMFAYGTGILALLEWDSAATWPELILPITCAVLAILVSYLCWKKARKIDPNRWWPEDWWPEERWQQWSFISDTIITVGYVLAWALASWALLSTEYREIAVLTFLLLSNLSTFPSFYPLLRETYLDPNKEKALPWFVWTAAYIMLAIVTFFTHGTFWTVLMIYPVSNAFLHGLASWLARPGARKKKLKIAKNLFP